MARSYVLYASALLKGSEVRQACQAFREQELFSVHEHDAEQKQNTQKDRRSKEQTAKTNYRYYTTTSLRTTSRV